VTDSDAINRSEVMSKLAQSREEIQHLLDPPRDPVNGNGEAAAGSRSGFPRSRTMRVLLSGRGLGTIGALCGGLLMARPGLALRLLRMVPASAVAKILVSRAVSALRDKHKNGGDG
jgi:hypothetical protein